MIPPLFFLVHYGFFHFVYAVFLSSLGSPLNTIQGGVSLCIAAFFLAHGFSFFFHRSSDDGDIQNVAKVFSEPYARIVPMHLFIIFGLGFFRMLVSDDNLLLVIGFLLLKTAVDMFLHFRKHQVRA